MPGTWPAPAKNMEDARMFLKECASSRERTLILPDKDADGLCAGLIIYRTLVLLGVSPTQISVHFVSKGSNVHEEEERTQMQTYGAKYVIAVDQGSRGGGPLLESTDGGEVKCLVVDHHWSKEFPDGALVLSAAQSPPVATSSTLAYVLCCPLHSKVCDVSDYLCAIGTMGDLGSNMKWEDPWPVEDMKSCIKKYGKKTLSDAVRLVNAPRRTASYDVSAAWQSLLYTSSPRSITEAPTASTPSFIRRLYTAQAEVKSETDRWSHAPPKFSGDGRVALIRITSSAQIHPLIATRWANSLKSSKLEIVMCANDGYLPNMTNFSCRVARCAPARGGNASTSSDPQVPVNIIEVLIEYASRVPGLRESMGTNFARGHKEASGGIVRSEDFERLWSVMQESQTPQDDGGSPRKKRKKTESPQKNTLEGWVKKT
ncbi:hypothetical protein EIP91_005228 [Steccherinum ochraceum]|uniref:DDH domain-containing protein n=1 Tax=Steccherinum ochraceum TaxID=92696 RepID=A0A4V2MVR2_9APHY|nr:hypothetical protein EIP91_005228 [Steccherinum ochraceum]